jgi:hypothetical protein
MDESVDSKKTQERSPRFPFIPLERALERARQFYEEEKRGVAPFTRIVMHWGYTDTSSGGLQTISALKAYGLLEEMGGAAKARQFKLSDLALRILLDQRPDSSDKLMFMRTAALAPAISAEIHEKWPDGLPSDSTLNHFLVLERRFNEGTATSAIKIIKLNQELTSGAVQKLESSVPELKEESMDESLVVNANSSRADPVPRAVVHSSGGVKVSSAQPQLVLRHRGLSIAIEFSEEPTKEAFEYLAAFATFQSASAPTISELAARANEN